MATISKSGIGDGNLINAEHITRIIDALSGTGSADIIVTGSFTGSFTGSLQGTASFAETALSSSYAVTASFALNGGGGGGTTFERRHDFQSPYDYCGVAPDGTAESAPNWTITRLTVFLNGSVVTGTAVGAWTNRTELIYDTPIPT
jgi:hypothetical protein